MRAYRFIFITFIFVNLVYKLNGQQAWNLEMCIDYAIENNIQIKQSQLQAKISASNLQQSKAGVLPNINASFSDAFQFGRSIDPYTNQYTENNIQSFSGSIDASFTLFKGFQKINNIKLYNYDMLASLAGVEEMKNSISMQVATAYLQIVFNTEALGIARGQQKVTQKQVKRTEALVESGRISKSSLLEIQAQLSEEEFNVINAKHNVKKSYLTLTQLLELDTTETFQISHPDIELPSEATLLNSESRISEKSKELPRVKKQEYYLESSEARLKVARGNFSPRFYLNASYGTGYSSARNKFLTSPADPQEIGYVGSSGDAVLAPAYTNTALPYHFWEQLDDNRSLSIIAGIQIPLFNNFSTRNQIKTTKLRIENSRYELALTKKQLYKDIQLAKQAAEASLAKYQASEKALAARRESFTYVEEKFNLGLLNSIDYNMAKNLLIKAESEILQAKFEFVFRVNVLKFYQGEGFKL